jgi:SSS family solute:Na+ symporter
VRFNVFGENPPEYFYAPIVWAMTLLGCVLGSLLTAPTKTETLENFYKCVRPYGFWGPIKARVGVDELTRSVDRPLVRMIFNVIFGVVCLTSSFVATFFVIGHYGKESIVTVSLAVVSGTILYFNWYRPLIRSEKE